MYVLYHWTAAYNTGGTFLPQRQRAQRRVRREYLKRGLSTYPLCFAYERVGATAACLCCCVCISTKSRGGLSNQFCISRFRRHSCDRVLASYLNMSIPGCTLLYYMDKMRQINMLYYINGSICVISLRYIAATASLNRTPTAVMVAPTSIS